MKNFITVNPAQLDFNPFQGIGMQWMLITAGKLSRFNTMTASWGGMGVLWNQNVCFAFIRPQRFTFEFAESSPGFTLCFFEERYRDALAFCGSHSGRDVDKAAETGLTPVEGPDGFVYFNEAELVFLCRKKYIHDIDPAHFLDPAIHEAYPIQDYHRMYIGEIIRCLKRKSGE
ncbi:flavin reductase [bacterium]|nr:flavin reductase [candidate division CSSED10-310 bacterium]